MTGIAQRGGQRPPEIVEIPFRIGKKNDFQTVFAPTYSHSGNGATPYPGRRSNRFHPPQPLLTSLTNLFHLEASKAPNITPGRVAMGDCSPAAHTCPPQLRHPAPGCSKRATWRTYWLKHECRRIAELRGAVYVPGGGLPEVRLAFCHERASHLTAGATKPVPGLTPCRSPPRSKTGSGRSPMSLRLTAA